MALEGRRGLVVDSDTFVLRQDHVLVQNTSQAVLVMGFGPRADRLRRLACAETEDEDNPFVTRCLGVVCEVEKGHLAKARQSGIPRSTLKIKDPMLRRLAIAEALAKAGFDPDEPRDERGRWTSGGGGDEEEPTLIEGLRRRDAAAGLASRGAWALAGRLKPLALRGLALLAERFSVPTLFLGTIFIPSNSDLQRRGTIPGRSDIAFDYDEDTGNLNLLRDGEFFYAGRNELGVFRDKHGHAFGRYVGGNIVLDPDALPIAAMQAHQDAGSRSNPQSLSEADTDRNEPKLCPKPSAEPSSKGFSLEAQLYQWQITKLDPGLGVKLNGVMFDGCRESDGTMLEAKNAYLHFMIGGPSTKWIWDNKIEPDMINQAEDQSIAAEATGRRVEWYFAEKPVADYFRERFAKKDLANITVFYEPYIIEILP